MSARENTEVTLNRAIEMHRAGQLQAAAEIYSRLCERDPGNADACYGLGTVLMQQGDFVKALALLNQAVSTSPEVPEFLSNQACAMRQLGHNEEAASCYIRAARLAAADPTMLASICSQLMALRHYHDAARILAAASRQSPDSRIIWLTFGRALGKIRDYKAAILAHDRALAMQPGSAAEMLAHAELLFMAKRPADARTALDKALDLGSDDPRARYLLARCERIAGHYASERSLLTRAIELRPSYGDAWQLLSETAPDHELPAMIERCDKLADDEATEPHDGIVLSFSAGRALERCADYESAFEHYQDANERQRDDALSRGIVYDRARSSQFVERVRSEFQARPGSATATPADKRPIFIVGMPRSGTTLVERVLGGLSGVVNCGESEALELVTSSYYVALEHGRARPVRELQAADWDELAARYWRLQTDSRARITDKTPTNFRHVGMILGMFPDAPVIYMRRDPRDVGLSIYSRRFPDGHPYATSLDDLAHYYSASLTLMSHWKSLYPERILEMSYEQLIGEPESQTRALAEFCKLDWRPECLEFHERKDASFTFSELQVREPLNAKGIGRWRKYAKSLTPFIDACIAHGVQLRDN